MLTWKKEAAGIYAASNSAATFHIEKQPNRRWLMLARPHDGRGRASANRLTLREAKKAAESQSCEKRYH